MVLAAGRGTRLLPYTRHTPKPLFTLGGRPLLALILERLQQAGCREVMINTHHLHEQIEALVNEGDYRMALHTVHEPQILGTGGALRNVADYWSQGPLLVVNADIVSDIDLTALWACHCTEGHAVTMAMHHHPDFNNVAVDDDEFVTGFDAATATAPTTHPMAFTGIHVLSPRVLDFLPPSGPAHIIDAYARMLQAGLRIKAHVVRDHYWRDIGAPEAYREAACDAMVPAAFADAFARPPEGPVRCRPLQGDGSDRRWFRLQSGRHSLVMVDHGIRTQRDACLEVDAFVAIGRHLHARGVAVPRIHGYDTFAGLVFLEDLGDRHLQTVVQNAAVGEIGDRYREVIDRWRTMALAGAEGFDTAWTYQSAFYDRRLILQRECRYFLEAFVQGYLGLQVPYDHLAAEFDALADYTLAAAWNGFMHRDLQSRNIMLGPRGVCFIDFQGGRVGPLQYDLASLLIDPYVNLPHRLQADLLDYALRRLQRRCDVPPDLFRKGYAACTVTRGLQMLGAFAFLSRVKGKMHFAAHIPTALATLRHRLERLAPVLPLPDLTALVARISASQRITNKQGGLP
ncbi:sugar phosphate nucleotidyltransferase [Desulfatitalea alkaliphila]|uniref:Sugar phosphate nucleotidyltransferase n=1 Tax=Desulfatitalea alkaliphila TaxID=2929485 RepID=A0AA41R2E0_9BACT|nr:sugar phosphate nucleotidyltransferase [Desulfatitalea alkaliphila]MCJ8500814.1 sugar phosphate nucleotidyltransferase [Desulfatitalea alkaliphila]